MDGYESVRMVLDPNLDDVKVILFFHFMHVRHVNRQLTLPPASR